MPKRVKKEARSTNLNPSVSLQLYQNNNEEMVKGRNSLPTLTGNETGEDIILRFNEFYRKQKQQDSDSSLSNLEYSHSKIIRARESKAVMLRRILVFCCLCLWVITVAYMFLWFFLFFIWPMSFIGRDISRAPNADDNFSLTGKYTMLICLSMHTFIVASWGLVGAYCGRKRILKAFMLIAPWFLVISFMYSALIIIFVGTLNHEKIQMSMEKGLGIYYKTEEDSRYKKARETWDRAQTVLHCCGIETPNDWIESNVNEVNRKVPDSCCKAEGAERRETNLEVRKKCVLEGKPTWEKGCKNKIFEFYLLVGGVGMFLGFSTSILIILSTVFAAKYYEATMRIEDLSFKYTAKDYFTDFICMRRIFKRFGIGGNKIKKKKSTIRDMLDPTSILYINPIEDNASETNSQIRIKDLQPIDKKIPY